MCLTSAHLLAGCAATAGDATLKEEEILALEILLLALELAHQALLLLRSHRRRRRGQAREKVGQEVLALLRQGQLDRRAEARVQHRLELHHTDLPGLPHLVAEGRADHRELSAGSHALRESITVLGDVLDVDVSAVPLLELNAQGQAALHLPGLTVHLLLRERADLIGVQRIGAGVEVKRVLEDVVADAVFGAGLPPTLDATKPWTQVEALQHASASSNETAARAVGLVLLVLAMADARGSGRLSSEDSDAKA
eukprot:CAMPEP_0177373928 /NCGR_PEP_ID=MMETSP0368-20130122/43879_1 /TAXON_ID=447022 ORGANISM="Scrippsiella hangoei-like, Strain SHHI-4" /NCGR_SAMPLE_ID=MMETSP0368 /ASSEMBLY_ACC=CAM_ASM_000363 /LENGTH=252 /DNA_ID=CAMNT_0018837477 /DNA_START=279 /DNA_END=1039 /DNA_ORIENTATION=-